MKEDWGNDLWDTTELNTKNIIRQHLQQNGIKILRPYTAVYFIYLSDYYSTNTNRTNKYIRIYYVNDSEMLSDLMLPTSRLNATKGEQDTIFSYHRDFVGDGTDVPQESYHYDLQDPEALDKLVADIRRTAPHDTQRNTQ